MLLCTPALPAKPCIARLSYATRIVQTVKGSDIETKPIVMKIKNDEKQKNSDLCPVIFYGSVVAAVGMPFCRGSRLPSEAAVHRAYCSHK